MIVERYFERRQIREAIEFAESGGIAVHRNFDSYDGQRSPRGFVMAKPFLHVIGRRPNLEEWGRRHGLRPEWIQPELRRSVAHYDVFGEFAQRLIDRLTMAPDAAEQFRRFASVSSPLYALLSTAVAGDPELLRLAAGAQRGQPAPNLLYGAVHYLLLRGADHALAAYYPTVGGTRGPDEGAARLFRAFCLEQSAPIRQLLAERRVQTNEVQRSSSLLPGFETVARRSGRPLALIELGASAGLNLNFDLYSYDYGAAGRVGAPGNPVELVPQVRGELLPPLPGDGRYPEVAWRAGIELRPVDVGDPDQALWLEALVWPDQPWRREALRAAISAWRRRPVRLAAGDMVEVLPDLLAEAPRQAALVVYHTYAVYQLSAAGRQRLGTILDEESRRRDLHRLSIEWYESSRPLLEMTSWEGGRRSSTLLAACSEHGQWLQWLDVASGRPTTVPA